MKLTESHTVDCDGEEHIITVRLNRRGQIEAIVLDDHGGVDDDAELALVALGGNDLPRCARFAATLRHLHNIRRRCNHDDC